MWTLIFINPGQEAIAINRYRFPEEFMKIKPEPIYVLNNSRE